MWTPGGPQTARFPPILDVHDDYRFTGNEMLLDTSFPAFFRIPQVPFPFSSSIVLHRDKQPDVSPDKFKVLARSTPSTFPTTLNRTEPIDPSGTGHETVSTERFAGRRSTSSVNGSSSV